MRSKTLRGQFLIRILSILLVIAVLSGTVQLYLMNDQIVKQTNLQADAVASNVLRGVNETELATKTIEHQIDLKLVAYSKHIADLIKNKEKNEITNEDLVEIKDELGLAGITIFSETGSKDDIVGFAATEPQEVGFSLKEAGFLEIGKLLLEKGAPNVPGATFTDDNIAVLPIAQSASHTDKPTFFKYAYYHVPNTKYIINPYIEANEVYDYIEEVGIAATINQVIKENDVVEEIAVLTPKVFADPSLENKIYPPLKKVEAGTFKYQSKKDEDILTKSNVPKTNYIDRLEEKKLYKIFVPLDENRVIYLALDYGEMSGPLYRHSIILIISGLMSLIALFLLTARFFNVIYESIQKIINQMNLLEAGDLTAQSEVKDGTELQKLSQSTNRMVDKLNTLVSDTQEQASKTQRLSVMLEEEASNSVEKMYELSTEATMKSRDQLFEINSFLDELSDALESYKDNEQVLSVIEKVEQMKQLANERTASTTNMTITLSDLLKSLHGQSSELSDISNTLLESMSKFKL
ncbi:methyl-accepting chemotaxis protein [Metabacillus halosaccharovorans]|uniref:methyl-accepting chemotaxis protein n=1 Tax=Metabacillus halosaccharovorans TaxID=930124 RepID=UPI00203CC2FE|nr:methyl-accepting chemotaxis protein [Metabacillus halosaccharovorans]MCM3443390.1 methyl-accepting chemotaxis protein [Metabacillus halosaccharovorans]